MPTACLPRRSKLSTAKFVREGCKCVPHIKETQTAQNIDWSSFKSLELLLSGSHGTFAFPLCCGRFILCSWCSMSLLTCLYIYYGAQCSAFAIAWALIGLNNGGRKKCEPELLGPFLFQTLQFLQHINYLGKLRHTNNFPNRMAHIQRYLPKPLLCTVGTARQLMTCDFCGGGRCQRYLIKLTLIKLNSDCAPTNCPIFSFSFQ